MLHGPNDGLCRDGTLALDKLAADVVFGEAVAVGGAVADVILEDVDGDG